MKYSFSSNFLSAIQKCTTILSSQAVQKHVAGGLTLTHDAHCSFVQPWYRGKKND